MCLCYQEMNMALPKRKLFEPMRRSNRTQEKQQQYDD